MEKLVHKLQADHPGLQFTIGEAHCWSPGKRQIFYAAGERASNIAGLLHELGHARLGHHAFTSDVDLLQKEVAAWQEAANLAQRYGVTLDGNHIQDCLDSYRDWLYQRSRCPVCSATGVQESNKQYRCINCAASWRVSSARMRRPYRRKIA
jgi:hypothetical protein